MSLTPNSDKKDGSVEICSEFIRMAKSPFRFRFYLLLKLPAAFLAGLGVRQLTPQSSSVYLRYRWLTRNPFKSTYFASLSMAAEMSTGLLCMMHVRATGRPVSMLVASLEANFHKKAVGKTIFTCTDGDEIARVVQSATTTGAAQIFRSRALGVDEAGEAVAEFFITWSFRLREKTA
jgi:hypothetical protein